MTKEKNLAVLFADICKSTELYDAFGDQAAKEIVLGHLSLLKSIAESHNGAVVKYIGDEVMCTFPDASSAVDAAKAMQAAVDEKARENRNSPKFPNIRIGLHEGPVICEAGDVFGDSVNLAARMASAAKARQILATEQTVKSLNKEQREMTRRLDKAIVKGKREEMDIYEVLWELDNLTIALPVQKISSRSAPKLKLAASSGRTIVVSSKSPMISIGREPENDLVVNDVSVSRMHASIECRHGNFFLSDKSTNGTYVQIYGEPLFCLRRDEWPLQGCGSIGLGRPARENPACEVKFELEE